MILFLDFDGVLRPTGCEQGVLPLLPKLEELLREYPSIDVVVSSSWREDCDLPSLQANFSPDIALRVIGATPVLNYTDHHYVRQEEICSWLSENNRGHEAWVAIDDDDLLFAPDHPSLIVVNSEKGIDDQVIQTIKKWVASIHE